MPILMSLLQPPLRARASPPSPSLRRGKRSLRVMTVCDLEGQALRPGEDALVATVAITKSTDFQEVLDRYTACLAARYRPRIPRETATGWVDWQYYRAGKDEQDIRTNLGPLQRLRRQGLPLRYDPALL